MHNEIVKQFLRQHPHECAHEIENFSLDDILFFIKSLSKKELAHLMPCLTPSIGAICLQNLPINDSKQIVVELPVFTLKTVLPRIPKNLRLSLEEALPNNKKTALLHALRFSEQTVGAFMNIHVLFLSTEHNVSQALSFVRKFHEEINTVIFCTDNQGKLQGMVTLQELISTPTTQHIGHIMQECPFVLSTHTPIATIATSEIWGKQIVLPVVDEQEVLLGVLEYNKMIPIIQDFLLHHRKENFVDSLTHIMFMFSHTAENMLNELNQLTSHHKEDD